MPNKPERRDKLLAEWFWTDRWTGSSGFVLPLAARGLYREMLTQSWRRGAKLLNDPETIQRACGVTLREWSKYWPIVSQYWRVDGDYLVNDTQLEVYAEAREALEKAREKARKGAAAKHAKTRINDDAQAGAQAPAQARAQAGAQAPSKQVLEGVLEGCPPSPSPLTDTETRPPTVRAREAPDSPAGDPGELENLQRALDAELDVATTVLDEHRDVLLALHSRTDRGRTIVNVANVTSVKWLRATLENLQGARLVAMAKQKPPPSQPAAKSHAQRVGEEWIQSRKAGIDAARGIRTEVPGALPRPGGIRGLRPAGRVLPGLRAADGAGIRDGGDECAEQPTSVEVSAPVRAAAVGAGAAQPRAPAGGPAAGAAVEQGRMPANGARDRAHGAGANGDDGAVEHRDAKAFDAGAKDRDRHR